MIEYDEGEWLIPSILKLKGSVIPRALCFALPTTCITLALVILDSAYPDWGLHENLGMAEVAGSSSQLWSASTAGIFFLLGFRCSEAMKRFWEGTSLLHQMRGEWFDSVSCLMTFSRSSRESKKKEVEEFRHTLVRLMSLCHGSALEEIKDSEAENFLCVDITGLDKNTLKYLDECKKHHGFNRVEVILHMIQVLITENLDDGVLKIAPPILSRVYQTLARGFVNLLNATKIKNTRFPFPFAQVITVLLLMHMLWTPFLIASVLTNPVLAAVCAFFPVFGMFSMNFVAIQLEMPFGEDENDLPLSLFQHEMNHGLLMLLHPKTDLLPKTSRLCEKNVDTLLRLEAQQWYGTDPEDALVMVAKSRSSRNEPGPSMFAQALEENNSASTLTSKGTFSFASGSSGMLGRVLQGFSRLASSNSLFESSEEIQTPTQLRSGPLNRVEDALATVIGEDESRELVGSKPEISFIETDITATDNRISDISGQGSRLVGFSDSVLSNESDDFRSRPAPKAPPRPPRNGNSPLKKHAGQVILPGSPGSGPLKPAASSPEGSMTDLMVALALESGRTSSASEKSDARSAQREKQSGLATGMPCIQGEEETGFEISCAGHGDGLTM